MARPLKIKSPPEDLRAHDEERDNLAAIFRQAEINRLRVDPYGEEPLACVLADVLLNRATDAEREFAARLFADAAATATADQLAAFFARVENMKRNAGQPHRNAAAYFGYARFIQETGREPIKPELKAYLLARPETYKGMPESDDKKAWTRLWVDCGLFTLPQG